MKRIFNPTKKKTILIVDDDQTVVRLYENKLQSQGFKVEIADTGDRAIERIKKGSIDLMVLDLCLPGMNGIEVLKNVRSEFDLTTLPVVAFSNAYLGSLTRSALEAGANKCVTKIDSTPDQMLELVREIFSVNQSTSEIVARSVIGALAATSEAAFQEKLVATLLTNAPETLARLRIDHQLFAKTEQEDFRRTEISKMHRQVRLLGGPSGLPGFQKIAQMTSALEALFIQLHDKPKGITPSVIRTVAQAIDTLAFLFDQIVKTQPEVLTEPKILVVDDEVISREMICSALQKANFVAVSLDDSIAAQRSLEQDHFDLIFLDIEMPGQSGFELCAKIREMATNRATPVVFVTSHSDFGSRAQSTFSGGNDLIAKPFLLVELVVKTFTWLFKESPQLSSTATKPDSAPAETDVRELHPISSDLQLSVPQELVLEQERKP
jgi:CheY-like chemotaxis protein